MSGCGNKIGPYDCCAIVTGDARELAKAIPDESVDLVLCDPVWQNIADYEWLGQTSARLLQPGGSCIAETCHEHLIASALALNQSLEYYWTFAERLGRASRMWQKRIFVRWKPYLWFWKPTKEGRRGQWTLDSVYSLPDKMNHEWGDGCQTFRPLVEHVCEKDGLTYDPFCGGGTVPAVCKMLRRHYLAFEIDPEVAERARERVQNTQPPLFVMQPEQQEMEL